ncbi:sodium-dependent phosphate transport protein 2a [Plakobranchus ocellatus]|uniref:Sodium-dependent phosphate transport protein 2a n=1 Tax=Plakobranchus ocellatus TaxID=259542 RepID=A0AAV3XYH1_9GAST|nr:sodium-dependent phosphate transport protein 2a [Plakobranchus ocellatus]
MAVGAILTVLVQSSSVLTSALTPLVGLGAVHLERVYPIVLGANLGTTVTGLLAALVSDASSIRVAVRLALSHLLFNFSGILLWYPWPPSRTIALSAAKTMGETVARYPWFAVVYLLLAFLILPLIVFALSLTGPAGLAAVGIPVILLLIFVGAVNFLQRKAPDCLPERLQNWEKSGIPKPLHSLAPYDKLFRRSCMRLCKRKASSKEKVLEAGRREQESNLKDFTVLKND